jgi:hypothetical protein
VSRADLREVLLNVERMDRAVAPLRLPNESLAEAVERICRELAALKRGA